MKKQWLFRVLPLLLCLSACGKPPASGAPACRVVLEEGPGFSAEEYVQEAAPGSDLTFTLHPEAGYTIAGCDYPEAALLRQTEGVTLHLPHVRYSERIHLSVQKSDILFSYFPNGGVRLDGGDPEEPVEIPMNPTHLRLNTALGTDLFAWEGHTLTGWNTAPDGSGTSVGLGSRIDPELGKALYAQWSPWTDESAFTWEPAGDGAAITGYHGDTAALTVPGELGGLPVRVIRDGAFAGAAFKTVILPETLHTVEDGAFDRSSLEILYLFDNIQNISDYAFSGCENLRTLHISALEPPVYSGTYYAAFPDKLDRLMSLADRQKIVLFSGSSTRFGYDSAAMDEAFPDYDVVNMGVFAYTGALPQLEIIRRFMGPGDILLHAPEFDAAQRQFCTSHSLDAPFFSMAEGNYDAVALLDLRHYGQVFTALHSYLIAREGMEPRSYDLSPKDFDEDGNPAESPSYNEYGDYILYRPNAEDDAPVYGLPVRYTPEAIPEKQFIEPLNRVYGTFLEKGVRVYFTYAPRNRLAISRDSTPEARAALDAHLREHLSVPVISDMEDSLVSGTYLYGTDNHLSTQGVALRTARIIEDLRTQMEREVQDG